MRNRVASSKNRRNVLIVLFVILFDLLILLGDVFMFYNKSLSSHKGTYTCEELFSVNSSENVYDVYDFLKCYKRKPNNETSEEPLVSDLFKDVSFSVVPHPSAELILLSYKGDQNLAKLSLSYQLNYDENYDYDSNQVSYLVDMTGYCVYGTFFLYKDNLYFYGVFNDETFDTSDESPIDVLKHSVASGKTKKCLFKAEGINNDFINENFNVEARGIELRIYPSWYYSLLPITKFLLFLLFVIQFPIAIKIFNRKKNKTT